MATCLIFIFSVNNYGESEKKRELLELQGHLSSIMDIRSQAVLKWINERENAITGASENLTVKMYLTTASSKKIDRDDLLTQQQFTGAYLESVARNYGFKGAQESDIHANVDSVSTAAIMLVDTNGKDLLSIDYAENLKEVAGDLKGAAEGLPISLVKSQEDNATYIKIIKPISRLQSDEVMGYIVAIKKLDKEFFDILSFPPSEYKTLKSQLFMKKANELEYISEEGNMGSIDTIEGNQDLAEVYAINKLNLISVKNNIKSDKVFVSARKIDGLNIYLIQTLSYKESFSDVEKNTKNIVRISYLLALLLGAVILFVWKHSISEKYKRLHAKVVEKKRLLKLITENQIQSMLLVDDENKISFANKIFLAKNHIEHEDDCIGKDLGSVIGQAISDEYKDLSFKATDSNRPIITLSKTKVKDHERYIQRKVIPIDSTEPGEEYKGSMIVENDISDLINERVKYENNLSNSIEILVRIIEKRSKYFYNHAAQVHELSMKIADSLDITELNRKALDTASRISNLSLALVPRQLINKQEQLTEEEKEIFNSVPERTIEIIRDYKFDSPVIDTLEQINERPDGKGPKGLSNENTIVSARIIKVVNDYVAMISPRPYRDKLTPDQAIENLLKDKDTKYSKEVVFALANIVNKK